MQPHWNQVRPEQVTDAFKLISLAQHHDKTHQSLLYDTISKVQKNPKVYMCFLQIVLTPSVQISLREITGLTLKGMLKRNYEQLPVQMIHCLKAAVIKNFLCSEPRITKILSVLISLFVHEGGADIQILEFLLEASSLKNDTALKCLTIVMEDLRSGSENNQILGNVQFDNFIERLARTLLNLTDTQLKQEAMKCFSTTVSHLPNKLDTLIQQYVGILERELTNSNIEVVHRAMSGIEAIAEQRKDLIHESVIKLVARSNFSDIRLRKLEFLFWVEVLDCDNCDFLGGYISAILPKCINALQFTEHDLANQMRACQPVDDKYKEQSEATHPLDQQDLFSDDGKDNVQDGFTLRKMAGNLIGKLAINYCQGLWQLSQPIIEKLFQQPTWQHCEIAILYIGLIAEFCKDQFTNNLLYIIGHISTIMSNHDNPQLISTSLWTLSQFSNEIILLSKSNLALLENYINNLLRYLQSGQINIKQAACTSINGIVQAGKKDIAVAYPHIISKLAELMRKQTDDTLIAMMTVVSNLSEQLPEQLKTQQTAQTILKVLCEKWAQLKGTPTVDNVIECLTETASSFVRFTRPYCVQLYQMSLSMFNPLNKDITLRLCDLIISLLETQSEELYKCVQSSDIVVRCLKCVSDHDKQLKQSCYSLLSHIVKYVGVNDPHHVLSLVFSSCDRKSEALSNNCLFCMLQIMSRYQIGSEYVAQMYALSIGFLDQLTTAKKVYLVNYSKIIGKLAYLYPEHLAAMLPNISKKCFTGIKSEYRDNHMLEAYKGFFKLIHLNPSAIMPHFQYIVDSYLFFKAPTAQTDTIFKTILKEYRVAIGEDEWTKFLGKKLFLPAMVKRICEYAS